MPGRELDLAWDILSYEKSLSPGMDGLGLCFKLIMLVSLPAC